jgi:hypothetical protein
MAPGSSEQRRQNPSRLAMRSALLSHESPLCASAHVETNCDPLIRFTDFKVPSHTGVSEFPRERDEQLATEDVVNIVSICRTASYDRIEDDRGGPIEDVIGTRSYLQNLVDVPGRLQVQVTVRRDRCVEGVVRAPCGVMQRRIRGVVVFPGVPAKARDASAMPSNNPGERPTRPAWKIRDQQASCPLLASVGCRDPDGSGSNRVVVEQSRSPFDRRAGIDRLESHFLIEVLLHIRIVRCTEIADRRQHRQSE